MHLVKTKLNTKNLKVYVRAYIKMVWALFFLVAKITSSLMKKLKGETSMNNEKIVKHIHWGANNSYQNNYVIVLWSDYTWEQFNLGPEPYIKGKTMKQHYNFGKAISSKMTKNQLIEYLNQKKVEIES